MDGAVFVDINEAMALLKEILENCPGANEGDYLFMMPKSQHSPADGYQIHMSKQFDEQTRGCINKIIEKYKLSTSQEPNSILIYKSKRHSGS